MRLDWRLGPVSMLIRLVDMDYTDGDVAIAARIGVGKFTTSIGLTVTWK